MRQHNIAEALVLVLTLIVKSCLCERRVSQEEWHRYHFGGMAVPSDPNQWTMTVPNSYSNNSPDVEAQVGAANSQFETNIQTVEVGKDKLVLVNDEGSIKMVKASQLPTVNKQASAPATTEVPNTVIQMPLDQYYAKEANTNPTRNPIEIISQNYGSGNRVAGMPVAFATSSKTGDRPNYVYQNENPCKVGSDNPPIYIPAPQVVPNLSHSRTSGDNRKMVRIIIEMPESMTRNIDEASRYAATQVKRLRVKDESEPDFDARSGKRKVLKNVEVIRKIVQMEEDKDEDLHSHHSEDPDLEEDMEDEASNNKEQKNVIIAKHTEKGEENGQKKFIIIRKTGGRGQRPSGSLKQIDKYKKVIKVYRN